MHAPDEGRDLLTCGQCNKAFPLAHILAFIQHKQGGCGSRSQATGISATPPSPASRARHQHTGKSGPGPTLAGFIELRRGTARNQAWGEELGMSVKTEPDKSGKSVDDAEEGGRLLIRDSIFLIVLFFFSLDFASAPPPSRVQLIN